MIREVNSAKSMRSRRTTHARVVARVFTSRRRQPIGFRSDGPLHAKPQIDDVGSWER
jgi:hypothetical protein